MSNKISKPKVTKLNLYVINILAWLAHKQVSK